MLSLNKGAIHLTSIASEECHAVKTRCCATETVKRLINYRQAMHSIGKQRLRQMSIKKLEELRSEVDKALEELQALPERREIDIAADFNGDPAFIHKESVFSGKKGEGAWTMSLQIYCRQER